jgi:hypothetical protein
VQALQRAYPDAELVSARTGEGVDRLRTAIEWSLRAATTSDGGRPSAVDPVQAHVGPA